MWYNDVNAKIRLGLLAAVLLGPASAETLWKCDFSDRDVWPTLWDMNRTIRVTYGESRPEMPSALCAAGTIKNPEKLKWPLGDTAWHVTSVKVPLPRKTPKYAVSFHAAGVTRQKKPLVVGVGQYYTEIRWYDAEGADLGARGIPMWFRVDGKVCTVRLVAETPAEAAFFSVRLGCDTPNLYEGDEIRFADLLLEGLGEEAVCGSNLPDMTPPRVVIVDPEPTEDRGRPLSLRVTDASGVKWETLRIKLDGREATDAFRRQDDLLTLTGRTEPWTNGLHTVDLEVADTAGNAYAHRKFFFIGRDGNSPRQTLRDDGTVLVDGKPFFPIGIYRVRLCPFNRWNIDRAFAELKAAGFNLVHSYVLHSDEDYLAAARRYGMKMFRPTFGGDRLLAERFRDNPDFIAWYLGDDTSKYYKPWEFLDRDDGVRAVDTTRLTCQADSTWPQSPVDSYENYAAATDVYLPEIYPVMAEKCERGSRTCVARVVTEMKRIAEDIRLKGGDRRHSVWPIIQNFRGWAEWKRLPTRDEVEGMSFAALVHGANGITWYAYSGGTEKPTKEPPNAGITDDREAWETATNLSWRISRLAPVLLQRTGPQPGVPRVLAGPKRDANGNAAVTGLLKTLDGCAYYLAVNAADAEVTAVLPAGAKGEVEALWENRRLKAGPDGTVEDVFAPLGVHVYRFAPR